MKVLIAGGGGIGRITAGTLAGLGHEVTIIEEDKNVCERLANELDIMCICGDATTPHMLEKAGIDKADIVIALSGTDQENLITALVAKEYGVERVLVKLDDPDFNIVCLKLGIEEIINPRVATAKHIADMVRKPHALELSTLVGGSIRVFTAFVKKEHSGRRIADVELPPKCRAIVIERGGEFFIAKGDFKIKEGDRVEILCEEKTLDELEKRFG